MPHVYILKGEKGRHYIGSTCDLHARLAQHRRGHTHTTPRLGEMELLGTKEFQTAAQARQFERFLKAKKNPQLALFSSVQQLEQPQPRKG